MSGSILTFGTQWLGQLPDDWSQMRARYLFRERKQKSSPDDTHLTPSQKYAVLPQSEYMKLTGNRVVLNLTGSDNMKHVGSGDFVIHLRSFQGGIEYSQYTGKVSNAYTVLQPKETVVPDFFRHVLKSYGFISELSKTTDQLRDGQSIKFSQLDLLEFPLPSPEIQQKIADFLDTETAQIDNLIAKQERLLELLEEKRRATITHAVTRGLDPNVELKETNIPWLGQIPAHWRLKSIKNLFKQTKSPVGRRSTEYKLLSLTLRGVIPRSEVEGGKNPENYDTYQIVQPGEIVACLFDYDVTPRTVGYVKETGMVTGAYTVLKSTSNDLTEYYTELLTSLDDTKELLHLCTGLRNGLSRQTFFSLKLPQPPVDEQKAILQAIRKNARMTAELKQKIQTQITLLRERRTSLISHAVTGKIRV